MKQSPLYAVEGHERFCGSCGHDLLGLSGATCPRCGRATVVSAPRRPGASAAGRWVVAAVLLTGVTLALVGLRFRHLEPRQPPRPATAPASAPDSMPTTTAQS